MGLTEISQEHLDASEETRAQRIERLKRYLKKGDREKFCLEHKISRPTFYRVINEYDLGNKLFAAIVKIAHANKLAEDKRTEESKAALKELL